MEEPIEPQVLASAMPALPEPVAIVETTVADGRTRRHIRWHNDAFASLLGPDGGALIGTDPASFGVGASLEEIEHIWETGAGGSLDVQLARTDGSTLAARVSMTPIDDHDADERLWAFVARERMTELRAREDLLASEQQFRALAEQAPIGIFRSEAGLRLGYANHRCSEFLGADDEGLAGNRWLDSLVEEDRVRVVRALERVLQGDEVEVDQVRVSRPDGSTRWLSFRVAPVRTPTRAAGFVGSVEDVTERRLLEDTLAHDATHDRLTGLPNRVVLWERLHQALTDQVPGDDVAVLFLDLDDFKLINDSLGHDAGDQLLVAVAERLRAAVRPDDLVTRFGGDEFVVVCCGVEDDHTAEVIARRLADSLRDPFVISGREITITSSVGLVVADSGVRDPESLLRDADVALYQAKGAGKARWARFDERAREDARVRLAMAGELRRAIEQDHLEVHYQPIVELASGQVAGVEALARWKESSFGHVPPSTFIRLAEDMGMIEQLGRRVLTSSCHQLASWRQRFGDAAPGYVSVNLSVRQLGDDALVSYVLELLHDCRLPADALCLELTESVFMDDIDRAVSFLDELKAFGVRLAMDDFGTGYSSLSLLRRFPGDVLKIDRSFVVGTQVETASAAIISAVVDMARAVGLTSVAEGVETGREADLLRDLGVSCGQGFHLARPMPADQMDLWLTERAVPVQ